MADYNPVTQKEQGEIRDLIEHGYRPSTKKGGYKSIPPSIIEEAAEGLGLSKIPVIEVRDEEGIKYAYTERLEKSVPGEFRIVIPRRMPKWRVPGVLRHELTHVKLKHPGEGKRISYGKLARTELEALQLQRGGKLTSGDIESVAMTLYFEEGLGQRDAISVAYWAAKDLGVSSISLGRAQKGLRRYFKGRKELIKLMKERS